MKLEAAMYEERLFQLYEDYFNCLGHSNIYLVLVDYLIHTTTGGHILY